MTDEPTHAALMRAVGQIEGKIDGLTQRVDQISHEVTNGLRDDLKEVHAKVHQGEVGRTKLWAAVGGSSLVGGGIGGGVWQWVKHLSGN